MAVERVHFRYIACPVCKHQMCWVNPRLPSYCPECAAHIYPVIKSEVMISDLNATLKYDEHANAPA